MDLAQLYDEHAVLLIGYFFLVALVGGAIGSAKGRVGAGILFGALLGPIGWIVIAVGPTAKPERDFYDSIDSAPAPISRPVPAAVAPAPAPAPHQAELTALRTLLDARLLTAAEYEAKRALLDERAAK